MNKYIVNEVRVCTTQKEDYDWVELCSFTENYTKSKYFELEVDDNKELFLSIRHGEDYYYFESVEELAEYLERHYNTVLEGDMLEELKATLDYQFNYQ
jgi:hypothetical protein